jgi:excisionase family DNA binding protein
MLDDPEDEISVERAAELLGISAQIVQQRMDSGKLSFRQVGMHRKIPLAGVLALKPLEDRRRSFASDLSADTEDLEENFALPPFSLENYELDRDPDETDEEYAARRAMFEDLGPAPDRGSSECDEDRRFENLDGVRTPLEDATENHEQIVMNIVGALKPAMDCIGCRTYVRIAVRCDARAPATELRSDILVRRGPLGVRTYVDDPIVVIEVMSPGSKPRPAMNASSTRSIGICRRSGISFSSTPNAWRSSTTFGPKGDAIGRYSPTPKPLYI